MTQRRDRNDACYIVIILATNIAAGIKINLNETTTMHALGCNHIPSIGKPETMPSLLWRCWLGGRKGIRPVKTEWWGAGAVIWLERGEDLHMAQVMPLPFTVSCFTKIQIGSTFLVLAHLGRPGKRAIKRVCVCVVSQKQPSHCSKNTICRLSSASAVRHLTICFNGQVTSCAHVSTAAAEKVTFHHMHNRLGLAAKSV